MKTLLKSFLLFILIPALVSLPAAAGEQTQTPQSQPEPPPLKAQAVKDNIYEVKGGVGANAGFVITAKEVLIIDAKMDEKSAQDMLAEIKKLTKNPVRYVVLTHSDGDHVNGLAGFPQAIAVISHSNTRQHLEQAFTAPSQKQFLPHLTFPETMTLYLGEQVIKLLHFGPAHTDGDVIVYFPAEKVAFLGDLLFLGRDPLIHRHKNGSSFGLAKNLRAILELDADTFIHGHGDLAGKGEIEALIKSIEEKQAKIKDLIRQGKTLEEVKEIFKVDDTPARPGGRRFPSLVEVIYLELAGEK